MTKPKEAKHRTIKGDWGIEVLRKVRHVTDSAQQQRQHEIALRCKHNDSYTRELGKR